MRPVYPRVGYEQLGPVETGGWCSPCSLPSVTAVPVAVYVNGMLRAVGRIAECDECGRRYGGR